MKKTENINLGGSLFTIDQDAFKVLDKYVKSISTKFTRNGSKHEIMEDIEIRMSEVLQENMSNREIISLSDVDNLKSIMGEPEVFNTDEGINHNTYSEYDDSFESKKVKRLYRDIDSKAVGGVCAGLSHYFGIGNPVWLRLIFAFSFVMAGSGLFLYIILWIAMPAAKSDYEVSLMTNNPVDIDELTKSIKDELQEVKHSFDKIVKH